MAAFPLFLKRVLPIKGAPMRKISKPMLCSSLIALFLSACGGSGSSPATTSATSSVLQGVAASGNPLSGTLSVSDCSFPNRSTNATINQDGTFSVSVAGMSPPYFIRASGTTSTGTPLTLYSLASATGMINVNPLTNLLVVAAAGEADSSGFASIYANHNLSSGQSLVAALPRAISAMQAGLQPLFSLYGIAGLNPFSYHPYQFNYQGLDGLFEDVVFTLSSRTTTLSNKSTGTDFYSAQLGNLGNGVLQSASLPTPTQYPKPGNARLTLQLSGLPAPGTVVKRLKTTIQFPLGVAFNNHSGAAAVNTAIPSGGGLGAIVYPSPALSSTNNQLSLELSSLNGIGAGEFLTLRCIVTYAQLSNIKASDFSATQTLVYGDIYKQQKLKSGTVTLTNLVFPVVEGNTLYTDLCATCHTLSSTDTVGKPTLLNKAGLIPATFATVHHNTALTQQQMEDMQAFLTDQSQK